MPVSFEIAPMWRSKPSAPVGGRNRATVVTNVVKPTAAQPVHAGGFQSRLKSTLLHDFTLGESFRPGYGGSGSVPHGGRGPACPSLCAWQNSITGNTNQSHR